MDYGSFHDSFEKEVDTLEHDIGDHYLSELKYGLEGTDGTMWSNYYVYMKNNHPILSICYTSTLNPYSRFNKALVLWNSLALMFFYSCLYPKFLSSFKISLLVTLYMLPYMLLLNWLATCKCARQHNCCLTLSHKCGSFLLFMLAFLGILFVGAGIAVLKVQSRPVKKTIINFFLSFLLSQLMPFVLGLLNWFLASWSGILCCPQYNCTVLSMKCSNEEYRCCPLLELCPINFVLNMYCMGESTFIEDKKKFEEQYPGRIAIDRFVNGNMKSYESGLLLQNSDSCIFGSQNSDHVETI